MDSLELRRYRPALADFAVERGASHFCTLKPGFLGASRYDVERELRPLLGCFFVEFARHRRSLPTRAPIAIDDMPFLIGFPERRDGFGNPDPHFHCFIRLDEAADYDEVALFRGCARRYWGRDATAGAEALRAIAPQKGSWSKFGYLGMDEVPVEGPVNHRIIKDRRYRPSFDLQEITNPSGISDYITKQHEDLQPWTHGELLHAAKHPIASRTHAA
jgi:hypothetical protein